MRMKVRWKLEGEGRTGRGEEICAKGEEKKESLQMLEDRQGRCVNSNSRTFHTDKEGMKDQ